MKGHMKPSMREKLAYIILNIGTNDLNSNRAPHLTAKSITELTVTMKRNSQNLRISNIIICNENLHDKDMEVNGQLKRFYIEKNIL